MKMNSIFQRYRAAPKVLLIGIAGVILLAGCKPATISIRAPQPSVIVFNNSTQDLALGIIDVRTLEAKTVTGGILTGELHLDNQPFETIGFLKTHLAAELQGRGYAVKLQSQAKLRLKISQFSLHTQREGQHAPYVLWAALKGELESSAQSRQTISVLVVKEHYPKLTYAELNQPLFGDALDLLVKEVANKILRYSRGDKLSDDHIATLSAELLNSSTPVNALQLNPLVFSNNPKAGAVLAEYTQSRQRPLKLAAIYGLGLVQARDFLATLSALYYDSDDSTERAIILKSILDLDSNQGRAWAQREFAKIKAKPELDPTGLLTKTFNLYQP